MSRLAGCLRLMIMAGPRTVWPATLRLRPFGASTWTRSRLASFGNASPAMSVLKCGVC